MPNDIDRKATGQRSNEPRTGKSSLFRPFTAMKEDEKSVSAEWFGLFAVYATSVGRYSGNVHANIALNVSIKYIWRLHVDTIQVRRKA